MTTYNGETYITQQLESILKQSAPVDEVIICDDRSSDDTVRLVRKFIDNNSLNKWRLFVNEESLGFSDNFWKAISLCEGDVIFLSDQDDIWYRDKVKSTCQLFTDNSGIGMVASSYDLCDAHGKRIDIKIPKLRSENDGSLETIDLRDLVGNNVARGCSMAFRKDIIMDEKLFKHKQGYMGHDWYIPFYGALKSKAVFYNKVLFSYRVHANNTSLKTNRITKFSLEKAKKRRDNLQYEEQVVQELCNHNAMSANNKNLFLRQVNFTRRRHNFIVNGRILDLVILSTIHARQYALLNRVGIVGGVKIFFADVAAMLLLKKDKKEA